MNGRHDQRIELRVVVIVLITNKAEIGALGGQRKIKPLQNIDCGMT